MVVKRGSSRIQADLNRAEIAFGRYVFRPDTRQLLRDGQPVVLNGKAFELLAIFLEFPGNILTREDLYERLWGDRVVEDANLSQTIYLLRRTLDPDGDGRSVIETLPRIGYRFVQPLRRTQRPRFRPLGVTAVAALVLCAALLFVLAPLLAARPSVNSIAARNADKLGEYHLALRSPEHLSYALDYFTQAERVAPRDAFAYAGAAAAYALLAEFQVEGSPRQRALVSSAMASSAAALRRSPGLSQALAVRGFIAYRFEHDRVAATRDLGQAVIADPNDAEAHLWRGVVVMMGGDLRGASAEFQTAHQLEPTSEVASRWLARAYAFQGQAAPAIAVARETLQIEPDDAPAMLMIAQAQEQRGDLRAAVGTLNLLLREDPYERRVVVPDLARLGLRLHKAGGSAAYRLGALAAGRMDPFEMALLYLTMGRKTEGIRMLHRVNQSILAIQRYDPRLLALL